jgi:hypothetical protein
MKSIAQKFHKICIKIIDIREAISLFRCKYINRKGLKLIYYTNFLDGNK